MTNAKAKLPTKQAISLVSARAGKFFNDMLNDISVKKLKLFNATTVGSDGVKVYMYTKSQPIMQAHLTSDGASIEVRFPNSNAVDRVNGWNKHAKRKFAVVYDKGQPYIVNGYNLNSVKKMTHIALDTDAWYTVDELENLCKQ